MNIFILDKNQEECAKLYCNVHTYKMLLEHSQMICTVAKEDDIEVPYKPTHPHHPCTKWLRSSKSNMIWLLKMQDCLNKEYRHRYNKKINHKSYDALKEIDLDKLLELMPDIGLTEFAQAMPDQYRNIDVVKAYRDYYKYDKQHLLKYTNRDKPEWL